MKSVYTFSNIILTLAIIVSSCNSKTEVAKEEPKKQETNTVEFTTGQYKTANIQLGIVEMKQLSGTIKVNGMLDVPPQNLVSISAPTSGYIKSTKMLQGMYVKQGQIVATLSNPELLTLQQDLVEARGQLLENKSQQQYLELDLQRQKELQDEDINAKKAWQKAISENDAMKGKISSLEGTIGAISSKLKAIGINPASVTNSNFISVISIYTPISGYVTQVHTNIGAYVNPTDELFRIVDTKHLHAELTVFERDVPKLQAGQKVRFTLANESRERTAKVYLVGKEISNERTVHIHCHLDEEDTKLLPGMYLKALVETGNNNVTALPEKAIVEFQGSKYIFVAAGNNTKDSSTNFKMVAIKTGVTELGYSEIILPENFDVTNSRIVINGAYELLSKMKNSGEE